MAACAGERRPPPARRAPLVGCRPWSRSRRLRGCAGDAARLVRVAALNNTCSRGRERKIARRCRCQSGSERGCGSWLCDSPWHQCDSPRGQPCQHCLESVLSHASLSHKERHCRSSAIGEACWLALIALCGISSAHLDPGPNRSRALIVAGK